MTPEYISDFLPSTLSNGYYYILFEELNWERRSDAPRYEYWTNDDERSYTYGRGAGQRTYEARKNHWIIKTVQSLIKFDYDVYLAGCFLNRYDGPRDHLGWHSDDDPGIDHSLPICVVTFGQAREIQWRHIDSDEIETCMLEDGSLFIMPPGMQQHYQHRIPKVGYDLKPRISLTYRGLK